MTAVLIVVAIAIATAVGAQLFVRSVEDPIGTVLPIYALLLPFGSGIHVPLPLPSSFDTLSSLAGAWAVVALSLHLYTRRRASPTHAAVCTLFVLAIGAISFTYLWSIDPPTTGQNVFILFSILGLFVLAALVEVDSRSLRRVEIFAVIGGVAACAYGLWLLQSGRLVSTDAGPARFATAGGIGDQADPNITAATLILPFLLALLLTLRARRPLERFATLAATIIIGVGILLTGSRERRDRGRGRHHRRGLALRRSPRAGPKFGGVGHRCRYRVAGAARDDLVAFRSVDLDWTHGDLDRGPACL